MKTIILLFKQRCINYPEPSVFWGLGDLLRGAYGLFHLSKQMGFQLIVDISLHPISSYLQTQEHEHSQYVKDNQESVPFVVCPLQNIINYINNASDIVLLCTNLDLDAYALPPTNESKAFMKSILTPQPEFQDYIDTQLAKIPYSSFSILHYRLGDKELVQNQANESINCYKEHIIQNLEANTVLISDSTILKNLIKTDNINLFTFEHPICHLGVQTDSDAIRNTLFELLLLSKSSKIKSFSVHGWISGFVHIISLIYDIPLEGHINFKL